jgi:hypothetical protein
MRLRRWCGCCVWIGLVIGADAAGAQIAAGGLSSGFRRVDDETVDQDQFSVRLDQRLPGHSDSIFGRLTRFHERFVPVTPLPDGSGVTSGTLGPAGHHVVVVCLELPARVVGSPAERAARRRHPAIGRAHRRGARDHRIGGVEHPGDSGHGEVPAHAADLPDRRLSAARLAAQHRDPLQHDRDADRGYADVAHRPAHGEGGRRSALAAARRRAAAFANRRVHVQRANRTAARRRLHLRHRQEPGGMRGAARLPRDGTRGAGLSLRERGAREPGDRPPADSIRRESRPRDGPQ